MSLAYSDIKNKALAMLARREYAIAELRMKLKQKGADDDALDTLIEELTHLNYVNDERYVEMMVRSRFNKGYGPARLRQELRQFDVSDSLLNQKLAEFEGDWFASAQQVRDKKYGVWEGGELKEKARQMRFLASRGFSRDQIEYAFEVFDSDHF